MRDISTSSESENKQDVASNLATTSTLGHQSLFLSFRLVRRDWKKQWKIDTTLYSITNANWGNKCWWITTSAVQGWSFSGKSAHCLLSSFVAYKICKTIPHVSGSRNSKYHRDRASISNTFVHLYCSNTSACMACYATALIKTHQHCRCNFGATIKSGVRSVSVCPSVRHCIKMSKVSVMISSPMESAKVFANIRFILSEDDLSHRGEYELAVFDL